MSEESTSSKRDIDEIRLSDDPTGFEIKKALSRAGEYKSHVQRMLVSVEKKRDKLKLWIEARNDQLENEASKIRYEEMLEYQKANSNFIKFINEKIDKEKEKGITKTTLQEIIRATRPEKPTKSDLDDIANMKTEEIKKQILKGKQKLIELNEQISLLKIEIEEYENIRQSATSHKGIYVEELKANLQNNE